MTGTITINGSLAFGTSTRSGTIVLSQNCQSINVTMSLTETLGYSPLGGLGTDFTVYISSGNALEEPALLFDWDSYPSTFPGFSGEAGILFQTINANPPDVGSSTGSIFVGNFPPPPPNQSIGTTANIIISTQSTAYPEGTSVLAGIWVETPGSYMGNPMTPAIWNSTYLPQNMPLNCITGFYAENDQGIDIAFTVSGFGYYNEGGGDTGEVLELNNVTATYGQVIPLSGFNYGPIAATMQYQQDSSNWTSLSSYSDGISWLGGGPTAQYGTHTIQVRDGITLVESNTVTYALTAPIDTTFLGLFQSDVIPTETSSYTEFSNPMAWSFQTSLLPDNKELANNAMIYGALDMGFIGPSPSVTIDFLDASNSTTLAATSINPNGTSTLWDSFAWDEAPWDGTYNALSPNLIKWAKPVVFKQGYFQASGTSYQGFSIGAIYMQYQVLGYVQQYNSGVS